MIERTPRLRRREMAKWEEGGRMSVSKIDVSMNAPIAIRGPAFLQKEEEEEAALAKSAE